jgi:dTDP-4-amino-4,6-dideoxygalactose transaminase
MIPFNKPYLSGKEAHYIFRAVYEYSHISGNGHFTKQAQRFFQERFGFKKTLMTTSCTDALEMSVILLNIKKGDQVIVPSYTFVSTANAFALHGADIVFADSSPDNPNIDVDKIEALITPKTKAIVPVHYAGIACDMDKIMAIARKHNLFVVEDAAQAIDSTYKGKALGGIGHLGTFSFHETKNIQSGEGGLLSVNDERFIKRAEIIWEKGTNRAEFFRGEVNKYGWVDLGSSFLPSDMISAFLYAQLENLDNIQNRRKKIWQKYFELLKPLQNAGKLKLPHIPEYAVNNAHMFYLVCNTPDERTALLAHLKKQDIKAVFHYLALHNSDYFKLKHDKRELPLSEYYENCLLRLPFYYELSNEEIEHISQSITEFYS